ncbi:Carbon dioxide concentrating mechanism protein CcmL [Planctomycetes bacterium Poly30]|uniref:Carbon dioxide concentrating mechanism protein CcmL n=1 Tax=Saltatorellus ferox TaxID=2528018 RepID=A0A518EQR9_9BACT|nr:Carbon dioxide concentrating mechanism protein CcmL [Planctomycetes bacterium Poly30]
MILADVIGTVVAQAEVVPALRGRTLLLVRPVTPEGSAVQRKPRVAIDTIGAGVGDRVLVIDEGNSGRQILGARDAPVKTLIVGFVDEVEIGGRVVYDHRAQKEAETI